MCLDSFFENRKRPNESVKEPKSVEKKQSAISRKYQESYLKYGFIEANLNSSKNRHTPRPHSQPAVRENTASRETGCKKTLGTAALAMIRNSNNQINKIMTSDI